nr:glycosyltransferase family 4 protein [Sulfuricystis multivorans]
MNLGGQELRILLEMERMEPLGCESWLAARHDSAILAEAQRRGLRAFSLPLHNRFDPVSMAILWRFMQRERIDVVNAHGSRDAWNAFLVARCLGIATLRSRHVANPIRRHRIGQLVYGALCDMIVTTSESIRAGLIEAGIDAAKIVSVPTGIDVTEFSSAKRTGMVRRELGIPENVPLIGMISILRGDKGPDTFLDACERLLSQRADVWCVLAGDGPLRPRLEAQHAMLSHRDRIVFAGFRRDIPQLLAELDALVLASKSSEGVPQVILQAHAARVPVVATRVGGISEVAQEGVTAFMAQPNDPNSLCHAMHGALKDASLASAQIARGYALVSQSYSLEVMLRRMADIYGGLANGKISS